MSRVVNGVRLDSKSDGDRYPHANRAIESDPFGQFLSKLA